MCHPNKNKVYALIADKKVSHQTAMFELLVDETIQGDKITKKILSQIEPGDTLLVQNVLYLGDSVGDVATILNKLAEQQINLCLIDENLSFKAEKLSELAQALLIALEMHKSLISLRSKSALQKRKANGMKLGRPFGSESAMKLDDYKDEILALVHSGMPKREIAKKYNVCRSTIYNFVKRQESIEVV